jgi:hypothetical protein
MFKLIYEFWGFCVNGGSSLSVPGGFASSGSVLPVSGAVIFPAGFESGSTVLLVSGSDGLTQAGMPFFDTVSPVFSSSYVGKWLVTWKSGSTSTDDSIYRISQWFNSSSIRLNVNNGGTPYSASLHPSFDTRTQINYRVIDFNAAANLSGYTTNDGLVVQFNGANLINTGQLASQVRLRHNTTNLGIIASPSGSWTPVSGTFSDPTPESNVNWCNVSDGTGYISLFGAQDYLIAHSRGSWNSAASWFHVEIPQRLYPQKLDPNVVTFINFGVDSVDQSNYHTMRMISPVDAQTRDWEMFVRSPISDFFTDDGGYPGATLGSVVNGRFNGSFFNVFTNKFLLMDALLGLTATSLQYSLARVRVRRVRFTAPIVPSFQRLGDLGVWLHVGNGVLWPWDNALLPYNLFLGGS